MQYFVQAFGCRKAYLAEYDMLMDTATEEFSHLEIVGATIQMLLTGVNGELENAADESDLTEILSCQTIMLLILAVSLICQVQFVIVYTPLYRTQAKDSNKPVGENSFTLLVTNVRMDNDDRDDFHARVEAYSPDILLINEPDQAWAASISKFDGDFPYSVKYPMGNTYGMMLLSKLPLTDSKSRGMNILRP